MWIFAGVPAAFSIAHDPTCGFRGGLPVWIAAFAIFGVTFFRATRTDAPDPPTRLLFVQTLTALGMNVVLCTGFEAALLVIVAVQLGLSVPVARALPWLALQSAGMAALATMHMGAPATVWWMVLVVGAQTFAFTVAAMAGRESAARRALEKTNLELEATRQSLARASRDAERLRIARDLHDLVGHDLVALHLELETARHLAQGDAKAPIERAQGVAKTLLADVRKAVSSLRDDARLVDVASLVREVTEKVTEPRVHLDAPASLDVTDGERANTVVRCVQEIVTNAIKHARAKNLFITLAERDGRIEVSARDDGRGASAFTQGNGLRGMRERVEALGGELAVESGDGNGFRVRACLPIRDEPHEPGARDAPSSEAAQ
jgi:signal transduction histidine kinase